jgi:broad specificity phosphatase PhoE
MSVARIGSAGRVDADAFASAQVGCAAAPAEPRRGLVRAALAAAALGAAPLARAAVIPPALLGPLRAGGCVIALRHAQTDPGIGDPPGFQLEACGTQRNLSPAGRAQAERFGAMLRAAGVSLGPVRSSRWCRCLDTAHLAVGRVEPWPALDSFFQGRETEVVQTAAVREWALAFSGPGSALLVTHQVNLSALTGEWAGMGEALVLRAEAGVLQMLGRFAA